MKDNLFLSLLLCLGTASCEEAPRTVPKSCDAEKIISQWAGRCNNVIVTCKNGDVYKISSWGIYKNEENQ